MPRPLIPTKWQRYFDILIFKQCTILLVSSWNQCIDTPRHAATIKGHLYRSADSDADSQTNYPYSPITNKSLLERSNNTWVQRSPDRYQQHFFKNCVIGQTTPSTTSPNAGSTSLPQNHQLSSQRSAEDLINRKFLSDRYRETNNNGITSPVNNLFTSATMNESNQVCICWWHVREWEREACIVPIVYSCLNI